MTNKEETIMLTFNIENINMVFDITGSGQLVLYHCGTNKYQGNIPDKNIYYPAVEIHISGKNQNDHHGVKHTMTSGSTSLKYQKHEFYDNEHGKKLEFVLKDDNISNMSTWNGLSSRAYRCGVLKKAAKA
jgi:hypothetical protein